MMTTDQPKAAPTLEQAMKRLKDAMVFFHASVEEVLEAAAEVQAAMAVEKGKEQ